MTAHKICIVDDHILFLKGMSELISDFKDVKVLFEATNGKDLIRKLESSETIPDIILLDIEMPEMDGEKTTDWLVQKYPTIKILILTMHDEEKYLLKFLEKGAKGYLRKNATPEEVEKAILTLVNGEYYVNSNKLSEIIKKRDKINSLCDFSSREVEVLQLLCKGATSAEIADKLSISIRTVEGHRQKLLEKSGTKNSAELVAFAFKNNFSN